MGAIELRLPSGASSDRVRTALDHMAREYVAGRRSVAISSTDAGTLGPQTWIRGVREAGIADLADLPWVVATLVATVARARREEFWNPRGGLTTVLNEVGAQLPRGNTAWEAVPAAIVVRPRRYTLRALFDADSGSMLWSGDGAGVDRWDYPLDHFHLPVPLSLATLVQRLVVRYELAHPDVGTDHLPFAPGEEDELRRTFDEVCDDLERALGGAYMIGQRLRP